METINLISDAILLFLKSSITDLKVWELCLIVWWCSFISK